MMITTFNSEFRSECAKRLGTHITVRNCSSSSTRQSIAVKVPYSIISKFKNMPSFLTKVKKESCRTPTLFGHLSGQPILKYPV